MTDIDKCLKALDVTLPPPPPPAANYASYVTEGNTVTISGQLCFEDGAIRYAGKVGKDVTLEQANQSARLCAINVLTQLHAAVNGDWLRVKRCVRLGVFVNATEDFLEHPEVANGASDLMIGIFGQESGMHARAAIGCSSLPRNSATEVEATFALHSLA